MRAARSLEAFLRDPIGTWTVAGTSFIWSHSATLCGVVCWGRPDEEDARQAVRAWAAMAGLGPQFDVLIDGSAMEHINPAALSCLMAWMAGHLEELRRRLRQRVGVLPAGMQGMTLAGISPVLGGPGNVTFVASAREGLRQLLPDGADALADELEALVRAARGVSPVVLALRALLRETRGGVRVAEAARRLRLSTRTLQRELGACGLTYRGEQQAARFQIIAELLAGDDKLATVALAVGLTEAGLTALVRARTGLTPGEYRRAGTGSPLENALVPDPWRPK